MNLLKNISENLNIALQPCEGVWVDEAKTELAHNLLLARLEKHDRTIIEALLSDAELKRHFFTEVAGVLIFKQQDFQFFLSQSKVSHSYTKYKNRIGLTDGARFLKDSSDIVLDFPFKDCVLNGGQSSEESEEVYFERNKDAQLSSAQLSSAQLSSAQLSSAQLSSAQLYTKKTQTRQEIFFNQVLAFDEIDRLLDPKAFSKFSRYTPQGRQPVSEFKRHSDGTPAESLIIKGNNLVALHTLKTQFKGKVKLIYIDPPYNTGNDGFKYNDKFNRSTWLTFMKNRLEIARELLSDDGAIYVNLDYNEVHYCKVLMDQIFEEINFQREIIWRIGWVSGYKTAIKNYVRNHDTILFYSKNKDQLTFNKKYIQNDDFKELIIKNKVKDIFSEYGIDNEIAEKIIEDINHKNRPERYPIEDVWNANEYDDLNSIAIVSFSGESVSKMLGESELKGQKSERLLQRIIESHTNEGDIVLDFHLGSGTTAAVAHKMNRQYIGVEQMDYIETLAVERLKKVIDGEQSGISKAVNWQGGGEFVYCELAPFNETAKDIVKNCENFDRLQVVFKELSERYFLKYNLNIAQFIEIMKEPEFQQLSLDEQKRMMLEMLDLNQLYVNFSEMNDEQFKDCLSNEDKTLSQAFYGVA